MIQRSCYHRHDDPSNRGRLAVELAGLDVGDELGDDRLHDVLVQRGDVGVEGEAPGEVAAGGRAALDLRAGRPAVADSHVELRREHGLLAGQQAPREGHELLDRRVLVRELVSQPQHEVDDRDRVVEQERVVERDEVVEGADELRVEDVLLGLAGHPHRLRRFEHAELRQALVRHVADPHTVQSGELLRRAVVERDDGPGDGRPLERVLLVVELLLHPGPSSRSSRSSRSAA